jgi:hypothetical protein
MVRQRAVRPSFARMCAQKEALMANSHVTWKALEHWCKWRLYTDVDWRNPNLRKKPRQVDTRLLTVAPAFVGLFDAWKGYGGGTPSAAMIRLLVGMIRRAIGSYDPAISPRQTDWARTRVVCDWMLRCALPIWLDRSRAELEAERLRDLRPLLWTSNIVEALSVATPIWLDLQDEVDNGTADQRQATHRSCQHAENAVGLLGQLLTGSFRYRRPDEAWLCAMAAEIVYPRHSWEGHDAEILTTVPRLLDILFAVRELDSPRSVADRCDWSSNARQLKRGA